MRITPFTTHRQSTFVTLLIKGAGNLSTNKDIHDTLLSVVLTSGTGSSESSGAWSHQLASEAPEINRKAPFQTREKIVSGVTAKRLYLFSLAHSSNIFWEKKTNQKKPPKSFPITFPLGKLLFHVINVLREVQNPKRAQQSILMPLKRR